MSIILLVMMSHTVCLASLLLVLTCTTTATNPKRGLAFADGSDPSDINQANQPGSSISWQYDWGTSPPSYLATSGIPYIPMQWGAGGIETFAATVQSQGADTILVSMKSNTGTRRNRAIASH